MLKCGPKQWDSICCERSRNKESKTKGQLRLSFFLVHDDNEGNARKPVWKRSSYARRLVDPVQSAGTYYPM